MKRIFQLILLLISLQVGAQNPFPINSTIGSPGTSVLTKGVHAIDSALQLRTNYADTTAANNGAVDQVPGAMIRTGGTRIWVRNQTATEWVEKGGASSTPNLQQVTDVGSETTNDITLTNADLFLSNTTTASPEGIIYKNGVPWMHDFTPAGWSGGLTKRNLFLGKAGNLTMTSFGSGSSNIIAIGENAAAGNTTGFDYTAIGVGNLESITDGGDHVSIGNYTLGSCTSCTGFSVVGYNGFADNVTGADGAGVGYDVLTNSLGSRNSALGESAGRGLVNGNNFLFLGNESGASITGGHNTIVIGRPNISGSVSDHILLATGGPVGGGDGFGQERLRINASGAWSFDAGSSYGTSGYFLVTGGSGAAPFWSTTLPTSAIPTLQQVITAGALMTQDNVVSLATFDFGFANNLGEQLFIIRSPEERVTINAGMAWRRNPFSTNTTLQTANLYNAIDAALGAVTITLPDANGNTGQLYIIKKLDNSANTVTVQGTGGDPIDGESNYVLADSSSYVWVISNDTDWEIIGEGLNGGGGATPTWQQTLTAGSTFTTDNTVNGDGNTFTMTDLEAANLVVYGTDPGNTIVLLASVEGDTDDGSNITMNRSSINLNPKLGALLIDTLSTFADTTNFKPLVINTTGTAGTIGQVYKATYWPGGGGTTYTFSTGLTESGGTVTNNLSVGVAGGQTIIGGTANTDGLTYKATTGTTSGSGMAHEWTGGANGATSFGGFRDDGIFQLQQNYLYMPGGSGAEVFLNSNQLFIQVNGGPTIFRNSGTYGAQLTNGNWYMGGWSVSAHSDVQIAGSFARAVTSTATGITLGETHSNVIVSATGQTITLPALSGIEGREYIIKLTAAGSCTIDGNGSENIDGAATYTLSAQYKYVKVVAGASEWHVMANN